MTSLRRPFGGAGMPIALVSIVIAFIPVQIFDRKLFLFLNGLHSSVTDPIWLAFTALGDGLMLGIILGAFLVVNPRITVVGLAMLLTTSLAVNCIKSIFPTLRPVELLESVHVVGPLLRSGSFPSGHTASSISAGLSIAFFCSSRAAAAGVMCLAVLMSFSRIFVGAHFPRDVLGGTICTLAIFLAATQFLWPKWERLVPSRPVYSSGHFRFALGLEIITALIALFIYAPFYSELPIVSAVVAGSALAAIAIGLHGPKRCLR